MITRFAPSPTGPLHLGHAYSALLAHDMARAASGTFLLRIEDIDQVRSKPEWQDLIYDDLRWLGLKWPEPVMLQSTRLPDYRSALARLDAAGLTYACHCTRRDVLEAASAPQEGAQHGPDGIVYPGTCRDLDLPRKGAAIRLRMDRAARLAGEISWWDGDGTGVGTARHIDAATLVDTIGDVVLARRDMGTSYHLSVVVDDAAQQVTDVVRGRDLQDATPIHVVLQRLLGLPTPRYHHHRLIRDDAGRRLAKRDDARAIRSYRENGASPDDIRRMVGLTPAP